MVPVPIHSGCPKRASHLGPPPPPPAPPPPPTRPPQVLADLGKTSSDFRQLTTKALDQLCGGLMPRLRPVLDEAAAASYELGEADLGAPSPWPQALLLAFQAHLGWLQPLLTPSGHDALVHLVLDKVRRAGGGGLGSLLHLRAGVFMTAEPSGPRRFLQS